MSTLPDADTVLPFRDALVLEPRGGGRFAAELGQRWTVGTKAHGGILLVLLVRAGLARLAHAAQDAAPDPLAVAADFLRAPEPGPVELHTDVVKVGRSASVVAVRLEQGGRAMLTASVTAGRLPDTEPSWTALPDLPAEPPDDALDTGQEGSVFTLAAACELRLDPATVPMLAPASDASVPMLAPASDASVPLTRGESAPVVRGWVRPIGEPADVLFALLAGDILPPTVFNLGGRFGWAPTVQLTALLRAHPAPGWLRLESRSTQVAAPWFDEDVTVVDAAGRLVCQARQLALAPL